MRKFIFIGILNNALKILINNSLKDNTQSCICEVVDYKIYLAMEEYLII